MFGFLGYMYQRVMSSAAQYPTLHRFIDTDILKGLAFERAKQEELLKCNADPSYRAAKLHAKIHEVQEAVMCRNAYTFDHATYSWFSARDMHIKACDNRIQECIISLSISLLSRHIKPSDFMQKFAGVDTENRSNLQVLFTTALSTHDDVGPSSELHYRARRLFDSLMRDTEFKTLFQKDSLTPYALGFMPVGAKKVDPVVEIVGIVQRLRA